MDSLLALMASAVIWQLGLVAVQRFRRGGPSKPPLVKLLQFAELDLLRALRNELSRLSCPSRGLQQKLHEVNRRIEELGGEVA